MVYGTHMVVMAPFKMNRRAHMTSRSASPKVPGRAPRNEAVFPQHADRAPRIPARKAKKIYWYVGDNRLTMQHTAIYRDGFRNTILYGTIFVLERMKEDHEGCSQETLCLQGTTKIEGIKGALAERDS